MSGNTPKWMQDFQQALERIPEGETITLDGPSGWKLEIWKVDVQGTFRHRAFQVKQDADGNEIQIYFESSNYDSRWGENKVVQEPDLGIPFTDAGLVLPEHFQALDPKPRIVGFHVYYQDEENGKLQPVEYTELAQPQILRASMTKAKFSWQINCRFEQDGSFWINDKKVGHIWACITPDLQRMNGWAAFILPEPPPFPVQYREHDAMLDVIQLQLLKLNA